MQETTQASAAPFYGYSIYTPRLDEENLLLQIQEPLADCGAIVLGVSAFDLATYDVTIGEERFHIEQMTRYTSVIIPDDILERAKHIKTLNIQLDASLLIRGRHILTNFTWCEIVGLKRTNNKPGQKRCIMVSLGQWVVNPAEEMNVDEEF